MSLHRGTIPPSVSATITATLLGLVVLAYRFCTRKLGALEKERLDMQRGAAGENAVARALANFPDEFHVINDLSTPFGNLDHVVIGPTGVFVIDAKNWRGVVAPNGKGELLLNGTPTDKPLVRQFVGRMMGIRDKVKVLAPYVDPYYHALFVFTATRVEAKWGTTSNVNCIRDDQLFDYIVEKDFGKRLNRDAVEQIAQAFLGLAHMNSDFTDRAPAVSAAHPLAHGEQVPSH